MHLRMRLQPGDMQFVYNHSLLHDRTGFTDWPEAGAAICCGCGWRCRKTGLCRPCSPSDTGRSILVIAAA